MLKLEQILNDTIWLAKMQGYRVTGTYEELKKYRESENCRDFDICCEQPEHLKDFYDKYFEYYKNNVGFITIQDFYNQFYNHRCK